ncbi:MAG TPA: helix-turn-helix transcriptional regulator [Holophagaceae bacterium]|nr:helix-turn-helix transcriptional regulator [Holophagaceae bacterium]
MVPDIDETLELSQSLFRSFLELDEAAFAARLREVFASIIQTSPRSKGLDGRFLTLIHGLLRLIYHDETDKVLRHGVLLLSGCLDESDPGRKADILADEVLAFLANFRVKSAGTVLSEQILRHLASCTDEEFRHVTVESLGDRFGYHPTYLRQKFVKEQGFSLHKAMRSEKFNRALRLLAKPDRPSVKTVATSLGFSSTTYFSRLFKTHFGVFPSEIPSKFSHQAIELLAAPMVGGDQNFELGRC